MHETFNNQLIKTEKYVVDKEKELDSKLEVFLKDADFEMKFKKISRKIKRTHKDSKIWEVIRH